jgi:hypothetical protein
MVMALGRGNIIQGQSDQSGRSILLALLTTVEQDADRIISTQSIEVEMFARDMGEKRGVGYQVRTRCIEGPKLGEVKDGDGCWYPPWSIGGEWKRMTGHPCPASYEQLVKIGRKATKGAS